MIATGLRPASTTRTYSVGVRAWARFSLLYGTPFWLVPFGGIHSAHDAEDVVIMFVLWLHRSVRATSASTYVTGVRDLHVRTWGVAPFDRVVRLPLVLKRLRHDDAVARLGEEPLVKRRVTPQMLLQVSAYLGGTASYFDFLMFTMMTTAFHGLLRVSEFTVHNTATGFDPVRDLTWSKVRFEPEEAGRRHDVEPRAVFINLGICKGDQFRPQFVYISAADDPMICAVRRLHRLRHWRHRGQRPSAAAPVFALSGGKPVHRPTFARGMAHLLAAACGGSFDNYGTHSLRRGGAQALVDAGAAPWVVQMLGRWSSDAYRRYCETDLRQLLFWTRTMGRPQLGAVHHHDLVQA